MLCRSSGGCTGAYSPMLHSRLFAQHKLKDPGNNKFFATVPEDRPLWVQFCSNDPDDFANAAKKIEVRRSMLDERDETKTQNEDMRFLFLFSLSLSIYIYLFIFPRIWRAESLRLR